MGKVIRHTHCVQWFRHFTCYHFCSTGINLLLGFYPLVFLLFLLISCCQNKNNRHNRQGKKRTTNWNRQQRLIFWPAYVGHFPGSDRVRIVVAEDSFFSFSIWFSSCSIFICNCLYYHCSLLLKQQHHQKIIHDFIMYPVHQLEVL